MTCGSDMHTDRISASLAFQQTQQFFLGITREVFPSAYHYTKFCILAQEFSVFFVIINKMFTILYSAFRICVFDYIVFNNVIIFHLVILYKKWKHSF